MSQNQNIHRASKPITISIPVNNSRQNEFKKRRIEKNIVIDFEDIAKDYAANGKHVLYECWCVKDVDGLGGQITLISEDNYANFLNSEIVEFFNDEMINYNNVTYEELEDCIVFYFYEGDGGGEKISKFYNVPSILFEPLLKKYEQIENMNLLKRSYF